MFSISTFKNIRTYSPSKISIRTIILLLVVFIIGRTLFLFTHYSTIENETQNQFFLCFKKAFLLDLSAISFLFIIPLIIIYFSLFIYNKLFYQLFRIVLLALGSIIIILQAIDIVLYEDWQCKLNYKAFSYLNNPSEIIQTASSHHILSFAFIVIIQFAFFYYLYTRWFHKENIIESKSIIKRILFIILSLGFSILAYRGGFKPIPINTSDTYFSKNQVLNDAATNTIWYLAQSIYENYHVLKEKPFQYYTTYEAKKTVADMYIYSRDSTQNILKIPKPNIVVIVLESFCADVMMGYNGHLNCTPNIDKLTKEGVAFTQCYAPGWRSDMGIASIISSVSCEPYRAITPQVSKYHGLASLSKTLIKNQYYTTFLYGGQLRYANLKSYIYWNEFEQIKEENDLIIDEPKGKLGIQDEGLFKEAIQDLNKNKKPFCSFIYTLSSHPPYDMPMKPVFSNGGEENQYINSVFYTDKCIGEFMNECKKQNWYDSTLFIFIADHGHGTPNYKQWDIESHRIPLLFYGNVLKENYKGYSSNKIISQTDLSATLLAQLHIPYDSFQFSKDALNTNCPQFAPFIKYLGYGLLSNKGLYTYDLVAKRTQYEIIPNPEDKNKLIEQTRSYIQRTFDYFDGL